MSSSKTKYSRMRPALGTFVALSAEVAAGEREINRIFSEAFDEIERLEALYSFHRPSSLVSRLNAATVGDEIEISGTSRELFDLAEALRADSRGSFSPFGRSCPAQPFRFNDDHGSLTKLMACEVDLGGIAKGFIADRIAALIHARIPGAAGSVNAGGDVKSFGVAAQTVELRLGAPWAAVIREFTTSKPAVATSSVDGARFSGGSSTRYWRESTPGMTVAVAVAAADSCGLADAFTKIGLFAPNEVKRACGEKHDVDWLCFDAAGKIVCARD